MTVLAPRIDFAHELTGLFDLQGKVAYVPGGYGGIGEAIAWALALAGAKVAVSGRDPRKAEALAGTLAADGTNVEATESASGPQALMATLARLWLRRRLADTK